MPQAMRFFATCARGTEDLAAQELAELGARACAPARDKVFFEGGWQEACRALVEGRTLHKVHLLLAEGEAKGLDDVGALAREVEWSVWIRPGQSLAVRPTRAGTHAFTSVDLGRAVGDEVVRGIILATGARPRVDLTRPEVEVTALLHEARATLGINLTGESLHRRGYRVYQHPAPLRPSLAAALLRWAGGAGRAVPQEQGLWDPMCGAGTLPIEAAMMVRRMPPNPRRAFTAERLASFPAGVLASAREGALAAARTGTGAPSWEEAPILGTDRNERHLLGAAENARAAGVWDAMRLRALDATQARDADLPFPAGPPDLVVTNPPYGLRMGSRRVVLRLYRGLLDRLAELGAPGLAVVTGSPFLEDVARERGLEPAALKHVRFGDLPARFLRYDLTAAR